MPIDTDYAHPDVLVDTDWVVAFGKGPSVRLVEVDVDTTSYEKGHIAGAIGFNWQTQLEDTLRRDIPTREQWEALLSEAGIANDHSVVLYGDHNNWFAAFGYWLFKIYGHEKVFLINGGRKKWELEGRPLVTEVPFYPKTNYIVSEVHENELRAYRDQILVGLKSAEYDLVDVRSPGEYSGEVIAPPGMTETAQRGGHIPGAKSIPWAQAANEDGTFKSKQELAALYGSKGVHGEKDTIAYCRIGERSSHTWFALKYLLGYKNVKNYDGSWTEWGSIIGAPIERDVPETTVTGADSGARVCPS